MMCHEIAAALVDVAFCAMVAVIVWATCKYDK